MDDITILYTVSADQIESGDQIIIDGDPIEVTYVGASDDIDEVIVSGFSHETGDQETYSLFGDDEYEVWAL